MRTRAFVCFSPGNRVSAAPSPGRLFQGCCCGFRLPSAAHSPVPAGPRLLGTRGLTPPRGRNLSGLTARRAPLGCSPWACERVLCCPAPPTPSPPSPAPPRDPASLARFSPRGPRGPAASRLLAVWSRWRLSLLISAGGPDRTSGRGPWTRS